jgi:predicted transcriptional regulator
LFKNSISGAPVVDESGNLIGVFSEKDVMGALINAVYDEFPSVEVSSYMSRNLQTITEDTDLLTRQGTMEFFQCLKGIEGTILSRTPIEDNAYLSL